MLQLQGLLLYCADGPGRRWLQIHPGRRWLYRFSIRCLDIQLRAGGTGRRWRTEAPGKFALMYGCHLYAALRCANVSLTLKSANIRSQTLLLRSRTLLITQFIGTHRLFIRYSYVLKRQTSKMSVDALKSRASLKDAIRHSLVGLEYDSPFLLLRFLLLFYFSFYFCLSSSFFIFFSCFPSFSFVCMIVRDEFCKRKSVRFGNKKMKKQKRKEEKNWVVRAPICKADRPPSTWRDLKICVRECVRAYLRFAARACRLLYAKRRR